MAAELGNAWPWIRVFQGNRRSKSLEAEPRPAGMVEQQPKDHGKDEPLLS